MTAPPHSLAALLNHDLPAVADAHIEGDGRTLARRRRISTPSRRAATQWKSTRATASTCAPAPREPVALCIVHRPRAAALAPLDLPLDAKFVLLWQVYLERSGAWRALRRLWNEGAAAVAERLGVEAPEWLPPPRLESLATPAMAEAARRGPSLRRPRARDRRVAARHPTRPGPRRPTALSTANSAAGSAPATARNLRRGTMTSVGASFGANVRTRSSVARIGASAPSSTSSMKPPSLAAATVIVHGLHGAGIVGVAPTLEHERRAAFEDFVDGFSTFLALRAPGEAGGIDPRPTPLHTVFPTFFGAPPAASGAPALFLRGWSSRRLAARPAERLLGPFFRGDAEPPNEEGRSP